jgi:5-methylcytosine-specific restriction endonuclease McrA
MEKRRFSSRQRAAMYIAADGRCSNCGKPLTAGWHADHIHPWSQGGPTDVINGQALCPACNLRKGNQSNKMSGADQQQEWPPHARDWQKEAWAEYVRAQQQKGHPWRRKNAMGTGPSLLSVG